MYTVYKLTNTEDDMVYVGSTTRSLEERLKAHIYCGKRYKLYRHMDKVGSNNFNIEALEESPDGRVAEQRWINALHPELNSYRAWRDPAKTGEYNREYQERHELKNPGSKATRNAKYYEKNKDKLNEKRAEYYRTHKQQELANAAKYRMDHRQSIQDYKVKYREEHKQELRNKSKDYYHSVRKANNLITACPCGSRVTALSLPRHRHTKKHRNFEIKILGDINEDSRQPSGSVPRECQADERPPTAGASDEE